MGDFTTNTKFLKYYNLRYCAPYSWSHSRRTINHDFVKVRKRNRNELLIAIFGLLSYPIKVNANFS